MLRLRDRLAQPEHAIFRDVFVCANPHGSSLSHGGKNFFIIQTRLRVSYASAHLIGRQPVIAGDLLFAPTLGDQAQNELNSESCTADDWFADKDGRICGNVVFPFHAAGTYALNTKLSVEKNSLQFTLSIRRELRINEKVHADCKTAWSDWRARQDSNL